MDVKLHGDKSFSKYGGHKLLQFIRQVREERRLHDENERVSKYLN